MFDLVFLERKKKKKKYYKKKAFIQSQRPYRVEGIGGESMDMSVSKDDRRGERQEDSDCAQDDRLSQHIFLVWWWFVEVVGGGGADERVVKVEGQKKKKVRNS